MLDAALAYIGERKHSRGSFLSGNGKLTEGVGRHLPTPSVSPRAGPLYAQFDRRKLPIRVCQLRADVV